MSSGGERSTNGMKITVEMTRDEIHRRIPYALICETRNGAKWDTFTRRRKWKEQTDEASRRRFARLFGIAYNWTLVRGVPDTYKMRMSELSDWDFLALFCYNL
jgi:hypothetical protein